MKILRVDEPDNAAMDAYFARQEAEREQTILDLLGQALGRNQYEADRAEFLTLLRSDDEACPHDERRAWQSSETVVSFSCTQCGRHLEAVHIESIPAVELPGDEP